MKKYLLYFFISLVCLLTITVVTQRPRIKQYLISYLITQIETHTDYRIAYEKVDLKFPFRLHVSNIGISVEEKPIAAIDHLKITIRPLEFWYRGIDIDKIQIEQLNLLNLPDLTSHQPQSSQSAIVPAYAHLKSLHIHNFSIDPSLLATLNPYLQKIFAEPLTIQGEATINTVVQEALLDIAVNPLSKPEALSKLVLAATRQQDHIQLQARILEMSQGVVASFYNLPEQYSYNAFTQISVPNGSIKQLLADNTIPQTLKGDLHISYSANSETSSNFLLGQEGSLESSFTYSNDEGFCIPHCHGLIGESTLKGAFKVSPRLEIYDTHFNLQCSKCIIQNSLQFQADNLTFDCLLSGSLTSPRMALKAHNETLHIGDNLLNKLVAEINCQYSDNIISGTAAIHALDEDQPLYVSSAFIWNGGLQLSNLEASFGSTNLLGTIHIDCPSLLLMGEISGTSDLTQFSKYSSQNLEGTLSFQTNLNYEAGIQIANLYVQSPKLSIGDLIALEANVSASLIDPADKQKIYLKILCPSLTYGKESFEAVEIDTTLDSTATLWPYHVALASEKNNFSMHSKGLWRLSLTSLDLALHSLTGKIGKYPFLLHDQVNLQWTPKTFKFSPIFLSVGEGTFYSYSNFNSDQLDLKIRVQSLPLEVFRILDPTFPFDGISFADIELTQDAFETKGSLQFDLENIHFLDKALGISMPLYMHLEANLSDETLSCIGRVDGLSPRQPVTISAKLPFALSLSPLSVDIDRKKPILTSVSLHGPIEPILELIIPSKGPTITGQADIGVDISGTLDQPYIRGRADVEDGSFDILDLGLSFRSIRAHVELENNEAKLTSLYGTDGQSGRVTGEGKINIDSKNTFPFDFTFQMDRALFQPFDYATAIASGHFRLSGNNESGTLQADIVSDKVQISLPQQIPELVQTIDVKYINQPEDVPLPTVFTPKKSNWPLNLDCQLRIPKNGFMRGDDWTSEWQGEVKITGTASSPLLNGSCSLVKGEYRFNGNVFDIREGTVTFAGDPEKKTSLYVIASKDIDAITAEIILKGPIRNPAISFRSNPPLSQREILSWILFNRGVSDISSFQGTELSESITDLNMGSNKPDVLTKLRNRIGIDKIDISRSQSNSSNEVSIQVGKYISRGILVSVNKSVTAEANRVAIEADILKNVKVQAQVGDDSEGQLQLKWKRDY